MPGGVNSPVRAFGNVNSTPIFIKSASGAYLHDVDGNEYVDFIGSWGPMILGHSNPKIIMISSRMGSISDNSSSKAVAYRMSKAALNMRLINSLN